MAGKIIDDRPYQQGDVLIFKIDSIPNEVNEIEPESDRVILEEGEATGHAHAIDYGYGAEMYETPDKRKTYLRVVVDNTVLKHEEHGPIDLPPGDYEIKRVNEWDHFEEEIRQVRD